MVQAARLEFQNQDPPPPPGGPPGCPTWNRHSSAGSGGGRLESGLVMRCFWAHAAEARTIAFTPVAVLARTPGRGSAGTGEQSPPSPPTLRCGATAGSGIRRLLAIGVGCPDPALRSRPGTPSHVEQLYVLGMPCVDNVSRAGRRPFWRSASSSAATVVHYEFMQDFAFHFRHSDGRRKRCRSSPRQTPISRMFSRQLPELFRLRQMPGSRSGRGYIEVPLSAANG